MHDLLEYSNSERAQFFQEATARSKIIKNPVLIEKDYWVCWVLGRIFSIPSLSEHVIFKGGTSLSKCYDVIQRFSEDIDLTLTREFVGITQDNDPATINTTKQRSIRTKKLIDNARNLISNEIKNMLMEDFTIALSDYFDKENWSLNPEPSEPQNLIFQYPSCLDNDSNGYIQSSIKLEFGAQGAISPNEPKIITPYAHQILPNISTSEPKITVPTLSAKCTFWEKITLLHAEYHRDADKPLNYRLFRHYYDIVMLDSKGYTKEAVKDPQLLSDVVNHTKIYFPRKWGNYDEAIIGSLHLYPNKKFITELKADCLKMSDMFFGERPDFEETLAKLQAIENTINS